MEGGVGFLPGINWTEILCGEVLLLLQFHLKNVIKVEPIRSIFNLLPVELVKVDSF